MVEKYLSEIKFKKKKKTEKCSILFEERECALKHIYNSTKYLRRKKNANNNVTFSSNCNSFFFPRSFFSIYKKNMSFQLNIPPSLHAKLAKDNREEGLVDEGRKTKEEYRRLKELEELRKSGAVPAMTDESGK